MLVLKPLVETSRLVDAAGRVGDDPAVAPVRLLALHGLATHQLAYMLDSLVRVSRRVNWKPSASNLRLQFPKDKGSLHALVEQAV